MLHTELVKIASILSCVFYSLLTNMLRTEIMKKYFLATTCRGFSVTCSDPQLYVLSSVKCLGGLVRVLQDCYYRTLLRSQDL